MGASSCHLPESHTDPLAPGSTIWGQPPCCARLHPALLPAYLIPHTETPKPHGRMHTPSCPISHGKVPSQSHACPAGDALLAPQCPAGVTTTQDPSFSAHSRPRGASARCHVHGEQCRRTAQELGTVSAPRGFMGMAISSPMTVSGDKWIKAPLLASSLLFIPELLFSSTPLGLGDRLGSLRCLSSPKHIWNLECVGQECHL